MIAQTITLIHFDTLEFQMLRRVEPSIRIAFPTDAIEQAVRDDDKRAEKELKRDWEGRWLNGVCSRRQEWEAAAIHGAWNALVTLEAVLEAQSDRAYWERELIPQEAATFAAAQRMERRPITPAVRERAERIASGAVAGLVAPGTDVCGMLAETRGAQLREAREALPILEMARRLVGVCSVCEGRGYHDGVTTGPRLKCEDCEGSGLPDDARRFASKYEEV